MKKFINRKSIIITSVALLLLIAVGTTLAYVFTSSGSVVNTFTPSKVLCAVVEANSDPVSGAVTNTGNLKTDVQIKNTGDTDAYIRVAVVVNWASADGTKVWAVKPVKDIDYTITYDLSNGWFDGGDGFYYYNQAISPEKLSNILIKEAKMKESVVAPVGTDGTQYYLSIEIVASAIQSAPASTVKTQWGVSVSSDGIISK